MQFTGKNGEFQIRHMVEKTQLNFPVANEEGIKSSVTQTFGGDCKLDQNHFLLEPVSIENLHNNRSTRNVWCTINRKEHVSLTGVSAQAEYARFLGKEEEVTFDAGFMWQETKRELKEQKIEAAVRIFAPLGVPAELMQVRVTNKSDMDMCVRVTSAIPIYGRSADNLRDHRHVTSLLHRIRVTSNGVIVKPSLSFDERGHRENEMLYFAAANGPDGALPIAIYPTAEMFLGEGGTFLNPEAVRSDKPGTPAGTPARKAASSGVTSVSSPTWRRPTVSSPPTAPTPAPCRAARTPGCGCGCRPPTTPRASSRGPGNWSRPPPA